MAEEQMERMGQGQEQQVDPKLEKEVEAFVGSITKLRHGKETKGKIYEMLQSAPPEKSIPEATFQVNDRVRQAVTKKGNKPSMEALLAGNIFAVSELVEIGNAGGFFEKPIGEQDVQPILQATIQRSIEEGVRGKYIDPVELQSKMEGLLSPEQKQMGMQAAQRSGVPGEAGMGQAMEQYADQAVQKERGMIANQKSVQNRQSMLQRLQGGQ